MCYILATIYKHIIDYINSFFYKNNDDDNNPFLIYPLIDENQQEIKKRKTNYTDLEKLEKKMHNYQKIYINSFNKVIDYDSFSYSINFQYLYINTPQGELYMIYNKEFNGFYYYSNNSINNVYIFLCTMHYVIKYKCRQLLLEAYINLYIEEKYPHLSRHYPLSQPILFEICLLKEKERKNIENNEIDNIFKYIRVKRKNSIHNYKLYNSKII